MSVGVIKRVACNTMGGLTMRMTNGIPELCDWKDSVISTGKIGVVSVFPGYIGTAGWLAGSNTNAGRITTSDGQTVLKIFYSSNPGKYKYAEFILVSSLMRDSLLGYFKSGMRMFHGEFGSDRVVIKYAGSSALDCIRTPMKLNPSCVQIIAALQLALPNDDVRKYIIEIMLAVECILSK